MTKSARANITDMISTRRRVKPASPPAWIKPQLAALVDKAPDGPDWLHEIKFDGYRMHARLDRGAVKLLTRSGLEWTNKYPPIAVAVASLGPRQAYLDGELCGLFPDGITSFSMIQAASDAGNATGLVYGCGAGCSRWLLTKCHSTRRRRAPVASARLWSSAACIGCGPSWSPR
jgi:ATP-dependent DNA ligase